MSFEIGARRFETAQSDAVYLRRRVRVEADAAASAPSLQATLIHVALATAYAERCCEAEDRAWLAEHRIW